MELVPEPVEIDWRELGWRPVRPASPKVDVRVREPSEPRVPSDLWLGGASLEDIMGASLVTYDEHLDPLQAEPIIPKAVFVRYETLDPVTHELQPVVIPAQLTLDAFADPAMFWQPVEEEEEEEEETFDEEMEDRRKLRSSIKGDPILLRAKGAPPPEPYLAPYRYEKVCTEVLNTLSAPSTPVTSRRVRQVPPLQLEGRAAGADAAAVVNTADDSAETDKGPQSARSTLRRPGTGSSLERAYGSLARPMTGEIDGERKFFSRCVEASATMSSFQKAAGRDKYGASRLRELDRILLRGAQHGGGFAGRPREDAARGAGGAGGLAVQGPGGEDLEARMATHIQRIPHFHGRRCSTAAEGSSSTSHGDASPDVGDASAAGGTTADDAADAAATLPRQSLAAVTRQSLAARKKAPRPVSPTDGTGSLAPQVDGLYDTLLASPPGAEGKQPRPGSSRRSRRDAAGRPLGRLALSTTVKLRDLDPHLGVSDTAPTQHLHSNWPDGLKRKVARHFYGMTHAQILEEEHRERMRDHRRRSGAKDIGGEDAAEAAAEAKAGGEQKRPLSPRRPPQAKDGRSPREALAPGGPAYMEHGLEIRIPNSDQPSVRVVVSRQSQRVRRREESVGRTTLLLDERGAGARMLRGKC